MLPPRSLAVLLSLMILSLSVDGAVPYETATHQRITLQAFAQSVLAGHLQSELGLSAATPFSSRDNESFIPQNWLVEGSIREDDVNLFSVQPFRFRNPFDDPVYDRGLTGNLNGSVSIGRRAFEWALEDPEPITGQKFSWRDGRGYFLHGLIGTTAG